MDGEIRAAGRLAGDALAGGVGVVRQVHQAIAARTFRAVGPAAAPVRLVHDAIASAVYAVVGAAHAFVPRFGAAIATQAAPPGAAPLSATRAGGLALAAVNGVFGDRVSRAYPPLGVPMAVRSAG